jgi:hypothetical protein
LEYEHEYVCPQEWERRSEVQENGSDGASSGDGLEVSLTNYPFLTAFAHAFSKLVCEHSNVGSDEHRTREGYKNKHKRKAFELLEHLADVLQIHESVTERAKLE